MKKIALVLIVALAAAPQFAFASILNVGQVSEFVYENIKKRGMVVTMFSVGGKKAVGGALKFGILHNKKNTETYMTATVGIESDIDDFGKGRLHLGAPINCVDVLRRVSRWSWVQPYVDFAEFPKDWEFWAGPFVRAPTQSGDKWTWKTHTGGFISVGKKFEVKKEK